MKRTERNSCPPIYLPANEKYDEYIKINQNALRMSCENLSLLCYLPWQLHIPARNCSCFSTITKQIKRNICPTTETSPVILKQSKVIFAVFISLWLNFH